MRFFHLFLLLPFILNARLLVNISPNAPFTAEQFTKRTSATYVEVDLRNPFLALEDPLLERPFVVISSHFEKPQVLSHKNPKSTTKPGITLRMLAIRFGYRFVQFDDESIDEAISITQQLLDKNPKVSSELPHISREIASRIYTLQEKIDRVLTNGQIHYWAGMQTLLGAVRHGGLIPWTDETFLYMLDTEEVKLQSLQEEFDREGLVLHYYWKDLYKIFEKNAETIEDEENPGTILPFRYPVADLFVMTLEKTNETQDMYVHNSWDFYFWWNRDRFHYSQIAALVRVPFGPLTVPIPQNPEIYLNHVYGPLWERFGQEQLWDHRLERRAPQPGASLVEIDDYSCAPWQ